MEDLCTLSFFWVHVSLVDQPSCKPHVHQESCSPHCTMGSMHRLIFSLSLFFHFVVLPLPLDLRFDSDFLLSKYFHLYFRFSSGSAASTCCRSISSEVHPGTWPQTPSSMTMQGLPRVTEWTQAEPMSMSLVTNLSILSRIQASHHVAKLTI